MEKLPKISESEWLVMQVLWSKGPLTANEVVEQLAKKTKWNPRTVKTLINRLLKKGALNFQKQGRQYRYFAAVSESKCVRKENPVICSACLRRCGQADAGELS